MAMRGTTKRWTDNVGAASGVIGRSSSTSQQVVINPAPNASSGVYFHDEMLNQLMSVFSPVGTASVGTFAAEAGHPGVIQVSVSAAGSDGCRINNSLTLQSVLQVGGGPIHFETELTITTLSNGTDNIVVRAGFLDAVVSTGTGTDGVYFEYDTATNGNGHWFLVSIANGVRSAVDTLVSAPANSYQRLEFDINSTGSVVNGAIGGVAFAPQLTTNIPSGAGRQTQPCIEIVKQLGAGALTARVDYYEFSQTFTTARS